MAELNNTPWPDVMDLLEYWGDNPPLHLLVKGFMGIKDREKKPATPAPPQDMKSLAGMINGS